MTHVINLRTFELQYSGISRQFDTSAMTKICDGFTVGTVIDSIKEVSVKTLRLFNLDYNLCEV